VGSFVAIEFADYLAALASDARVLGWIRNDGILVSILAKLTAARASLERANYGAASNQLSAVLNEIAAQRGENLSPDAAALLAANVRYAIQQLR
jgi:hypothetical protein